MTDKTKPNYYKTEDGRQLFDKFEEEYPSHTVLGFYLMNCEKYVTRYDQKNGVEDLEKALVYVDRAIEFVPDCVRIEDFKISLTTEGFKAGVLSMITGCLKEGGFRVLLPIIEFYLIELIKLEKEKDNITVSFISRDGTNWETFERVIVDVKFKIKEKEREKDNE